MFRGSPVLRTPSSDLITLWERHTKPRSQLDFLLAADCRIVPQTERFCLLPSFCVAVAAVVRFVLRPVCWRLLKCLVGGGGC